MVAAFSVTSSRSNSPAMKYRKLRIAWSVAWGVIAVLLCVLWVRSYWWMDAAFRASATNVVHVTSLSGEIILTAGRHNQQLTSVLIDTKSIKTTHSASKTYAQIKLYAGFRIIQDSRGLMLLLPY